MNGIGVVCNQLNNINGKQKVAWSEMCFWGAPPAGVWAPL